MNAMNGDTRQGSPIISASALAAMLTLVGIFFIVSATRHHELWNVVAGIAYLFLALSQALAPRRQQAKGKTAVHHASLAASMCGLILMLVTAAATMFGMDPVAWYLRGVSVAPSTLVHHPLVFNDQRVNTAGYLAANKQGWCLLEGGHKGMSDSSKSPPETVEIVLTAKGLSCADSRTTHTWVEVSGIFRVFISARKHLKTPYALTNVHVSAVSASGDTTGS